MSKEEFDALSDVEKRSKVTDALAWFAVKRTLDPFFESPDDQIDIIEIILGKYMNGKLVES